MKPGFQIVTEPIPHRGVYFGRDISQGTCLPSQGFQEIFSRRDLTSHDMRQFYEGYTHSKMKPGADAFPNRSGHI